MMKILILIFAVAAANAHPLHKEDMESSKLDVPSEVDLVDKGQSNEDPRFVWAVFDEKESMDDEDAENEKKSDEDPRFVWAVFDEKEAMDDEDGVVIYGDEKESMDNEDAENGKQSEGNSGFIWDLLDEKESTEDENRDLADKEDSIQLPPFYLPILWADEKETEDGLSNDAESE